MKNSILLLSLLWIGQVINAQDVDDFLKEDKVNPNKYVEQTFKGNRLINFHTVEVPGKKTLIYWIQHRFGYVNTGVDGWFGLDGGATIKMGVEYGLTNNLSIGLERSSFQKQVELFGKYKFFKQESDSKGMPFTISLLGSLNYNTQQSFAFKQYGRLSYYGQIMIARKINNAISIQISPTFTHYNLVASATDKNDLFSVPVLARFKFSRSSAITFEYNPQITPNGQDFKTSYYNGMGIGIDIETGGHVFQMFVTNAYAISAGQIIKNDNNINGNPFKGDLRIGFNISRAFSFKKM